MERHYNFDSIGDLFDYRKYLKNEIERCSKIPIPITSNLLYLKFCCHMLELVNILIKNKGYK